MRCIDWSMKKAGQLGRSGFGKCSHDPAGKFRSPSNTCPRYTPAGQEVIEQRVKFLERK